MTRGHDSMPEPPPAEPGVLRLRIDPNWASTGQVAVRATPGLARALLAQLEEQEAEASFGAEFGLDLNQLLIVVLGSSGGAGVWLTLRMAINAIVGRHKDARIRVEVGDRTVEISGKSTADMERLLEHAQRLWEPTSRNEDVTDGDGSGSRR
ncbi:hypothetical protein BN159_p103 (plasmid) [Streptomyces davaonensis JCM 4913]|uniref:Uncharacterized protein n=1 Tax=Streptomyces davaonensis (strain DSM 101723 / JCM 4913 / KCC S-0913 / 768) TaxID=1214101 RepID=K4RGR8_STRDJ|nr:hypothetical protein [Streptomyces davaonensis]CCK32975.1 hypothetical protein BN159_p103 [Streptomyces davaonensis JCM 4913]